MMLEYAQKDTKKVCCLQMKFAIIWNYSRQWDMVISDDIIVACFIFHNMIIEDNNDKVLEINKVRQNAPQKKRLII